MRIAYFDCFSGIAGDMTMAALVDGGVEPAALKAAIASLGLPCELNFETVRRGGFRATYARVEAQPEHAHRHLRDIAAIIEKSSLSPRQKDLAMRIFQKLGEAEATVHGIPLETIHFHEVGAVDSIVDIVGAAVGLDLLGVTRIEASPVPTGRGWVRAAHGKMPLPAPGTAELLKGIPLAESDIELELTTPTGAAILATVADAFGAMPAMTIETIGLGAGTKEIKGQANILRLFVGESAAAAAGSDRVWALETNIDDLPGEIVGHTTQQLLAAGALDAYVTPILMKKSRPGVMISILCDEHKIGDLETILFRETTTLGIRRYPVSRHKLRRASVSVPTPLGPIQGKLGWLEGRPPAFSPEYDDCVRVATEQGIALREVYQAAHHAAAHQTWDVADAPRVSSHDSAHSHEHAQSREHVHDHQEGGPDHHHHHSTSEDHA